MTVTLVRTRTLEYLRVDSLKIDAAVQRNLIPAWSRHLRDHLDLDDIGVFTVSRREDGDYIIDGQHRWWALMENNMGEWEVACDVRHDLTVDGDRGEAARFRGLNRSRKPSAWDDYRAGRTQGDPTVIAIDKIAERNRLTVALQAGEGFVSCVSSLRKVYTSGANGSGPAALGFALYVAVQAWGAHSDAVDGHIVNGLGLIYLTYGEEIDRAALIRKLAKFRGGPAGLLGDAKGLRGRRPISVGKAVATIVLDVYNHGRRMQLPPL